MSEAMNATTGRRKFRWQLLASVSTLVICASARNADAADDSQPPLWIELGGSLEHVSAGQTPYIPPFATGPLPSFVTISPTGLQKPPGYSIGGDSAISFQPDGTNWIFSASVHYGRGVSHKDVKQQQPFPTTGYLTVAPFFDTQITGAESHAIVDFQTGKDIGLGMAGSSTASLGVRYAQFSAKSRIAENFVPHVGDTGYAAHFTSHVGMENATRSFHGIGPSIALTGSLPVVGRPDNGELSFDWGANAAILFGRQKANVSHKTATYYYAGGGHQTSTAPPRARAVTVPNVGGFAGVSYRLQNAKVKLGYRADFFFGAMDGGLDTAKRENVGFYGPFANVSIGIGG